MLVVAASLAVDELPADAAVLPPSISTSFGASRIPLNGTTTLSFSIGNPNPGTGLTSIGFTDSLPSGLVVATPNGATDDCGGTLTATAGSATVSYSGGTVAQGSVCNITVNVTGTYAGAKDNSVTIHWGSTTGNTSYASVFVFWAAGEAEQPRVAADGSGNAVAVWHASDSLHWRIQDRTWSSGGGLSTTQDPSAAGQDAWSLTQSYGTGPAEVAVDPQGAAEIVWTRYDGVNWRVQARHRTASGSLSKVKTLSAAGQDAQTPQVAMNAKGAAQFVWMMHGGVIQSVHRSASGAWSKVKTLSTEYSDEPQVAMDSNGNAMVVWEQFDGASTWTIGAVRRSASGTWGQVKVASPVNGENPAIAMDPKGDVVLVWSYYDSAPNTRIQVRSRSASGQWSATRTVSVKGQDADYFPQVATDSAGNVLMTWAMQYPCYCIQARPMSASGNLGAVKTLDGTQGEGQPVPQVAMDSKGDAVVAWYEDLIGGTQIQARRFSASGNWGGRVKVAGASADAPAVAIDPKGKVVFAWESWDATKGYLRIHGRRWPLGGSLGSVKTLSPAG